MRLVYLLLKLACICLSSFRIQSCFYSSKLSSYVGFIALNVILFLLFPSFSAFLKLACDFGAIRSLPLSFCPSQCSSKGSKRTFQDVVPIGCFYPSQCSSNPFYRARIWAIHEARFLPISVLLKRTPSHPHYESHHAVSTHLSALQTLMSSLSN